MSSDVPAGVATNIRQYAARLRYENAESMTGKPSLKGRQTICG